MTIGRPRGEWVSVQCFRCGEEKKMQPAAFARNTSGRFFCSRTCRNLTGAKPKVLADKVCEVCDQTFHPLQKSAIARFCSKGCATVWQARNKVTVNCRGCEKSFTVSPSQSHRQYCSKRCEANSKITRGSGTYRDGVEGTLLKGYVWAWAPDHPRASNGRYAEHRLVVEETLGRHLETAEQVHHINGVKTDNRPENLKVVSASEHTKEYTLPEGGQKRKAAQARIKELETELARLRDLA